MKVPQADQERMLDLYARGATMAQVAKQTFWSQTTVFRVLHMRGAWTRPCGWSGGRRISAEDELTTTQLYGRGMSLQEIADLLGLEKSTVYERLKRRGVKMRPVGGNTNHPPKPREHYVAMVRARDAKRNAEPRQRN